MDTGHYDRLLAAFFTGLFVGLMVAATKRVRVVEVTERKQESGVGLDVEATPLRILKQAN